jgi:UPF0755 protein
VKRLLIVALAAAACGGTDEGEGPLQRVRVPPGAPFSVVADSLEAKEIVGSPLLFRLYARISGAAGQVKAGTYEFNQGAGWRTVLDDLTAGRVASDRLVIPEGWDIRRIAPRMAVLLERPVDSLLASMYDTATAAAYGVPGPTLEGYLYPATYQIPADSMGLDQREATTLASIVEREARIQDEMPTIAAVYLNRLEIGYPLQADPTVQYALGEHQNRLLYAHIDSVADHPYNTYTRRGLPPGPIGSPSAAAIDAVLQPADVDYLYFVARPDGSHVFNRHLVDHNRAKAQIQEERDDASGSGRAEPDSAARSTEDRPGAP